MQKIISLLVLILLLGCVSKTEKIKAFEKEVIAIHDEVMPKTIDINRVQRTLKKMAKDTTLEEGTVAMILKQVKKLNEADDAMSKWMVEYKAPSKDDAFDLAMEHLNQEKVKITKVKNLMNSSLEEGLGLLEKLEHEKQ